MDIISFIFHLISINLRYSENLILGPVEGLFIQSFIHLCILGSTFYLPGRKNKKIGKRFLKGTGGNLKMMEPNLADAWASYSVPNTLTETTVNPGASVLVTDYTRSCRSSPHSVSSISCLWSSARTRSSYSFPSKSARSLLICSHTEDFQGSDLLLTSNYNTPVLTFTLLFTPGFIQMRFSLCLLPQPPKQL